MAAALGPLIMAMAALPSLCVHLCARVGARACECMRPTTPTPPLCPTHVLIKVLQRGMCWLRPSTTPDAADPAAGKLGITESTGNGWRHGWMEAWRDG